MTNTNPRSSDPNSSPDPDQTFVGPMNSASSDDQPTSHDSSMSAADQTFVPDQQGSTAEPNAGQVTDATFVPTKDSSVEQLGSTFVPTGNGSQADIESTIIPPASISGDDQNELEADSTFVMPKGALPSGSPDDSDDPEVTRVRPRNPDASPPKALVEDLNADATAIYSQSIGNRPPEDDPHEQEMLERGTQAPKTRANIEGRTIGPKGPGRSSQIWNMAGKGGLDSVISLRKRPVSGSGAGPFTTAEDADFEVVQKLAEGGMGVVYVARQKSLNRELAIKTLKVQGRSGQATGAKGAPTQQTKAERQKREMFLSEALVTANLVHPNIIPIHELAETNDGVPYYVMKRVHGIPWNKRIREMSLAQNLEVLHKVCDAMAYAHHHGVINRDLKPENIMLGEFGEVLVLDWGLAVPAPHAVDRNFRSPAASFGAGTPAYMAPELWTGPETAIGEASDIYLLGAILFEIITHLPPHEFPSMPARGTNIDMMRVIDGVLRDNKIRSTSESGELMDIAMKAMRTDPDKRFGSVLEFQFAVRNFQRHEESRRLSNRAGELLESKDASREYHTYQTAAALFEESLRTWKNNGPARNGLRTTRLRYAKLASNKGDLDLGLQIASQEDDPEFLALQKRLVTARRLRASVKWAAVAAMVCVILLGVKAIYDNGIITNLNAEVETRQKEAAALIAKAEEAREDAASAEQEAVVATRSAETAKQQAQLAITEAETAKKTADAAKMEAAASAMLAATEKQNAEKAQEMAAQATAQAMTAQKEAASAKSAAEAANMQVAMAKTQLADAEQKTREAISQQEKAETAARVAQVEIQSQLIRGHTLSQNYADALREVDQLLKGDLLPQLPETIQNQRRSELEAQREQLLRRTRQSEAPVQSQVISPDGTLLVTGDRNGLVEIFDNPARTLEWGSKATRRHQFASEIYRMRFGGQNRLFVAVGRDLFVWDLKNDAPQKVVSHQNPIRGLDVDTRYLISGDTSGVILIHDAQTMKPVTRLAALTQLQDVAIVPGTSDFLYAGSRGGQSADILAYRIPADETDTADQAAAASASSDLRPRRLGQLRMTRGQNEPPAALSVSPDGSFLAISNQTNGDLLVLPRTQTEGSDSFPFLHPADLEQAGKTQWKLSRHTRPINDLRWSSDSRHLLTASDDRSIGVWDRSSDGAGLKFRKDVRGHGARVLQCLFLNPEATRIASSSADLQIRLWDLTTLDSDTKQLRQVFHLSRLEPSEHRPARRRMHFGYLPVALPLNLVDEEPETLPTEGRKDVTSITKATQATAPIADGESRSLETISTAGPVRAVRFNASGDRLLGGTSDGTLVLWNTVTGERMVSASGQETLREGHEFHIAQMAVAGVDRNILITAGYDGTLRLWDLGTSGRTGIQKQVLTGIGLVNAFAVSADGQWLATTSSLTTNDSGAGVTGSPASEQFGCQIWNIEDLLKQPRPQARMSLSGVHKSELTSLSFSPNGQYLATGGRDGVLAIWDLAQGSLLTQTRAHRRNTIVSSLHWLDDQHILSAGMDGQLLRWSLKIAGEKDPAELTRDVSFERDQTPVERVSVSPDRTQMLVISVDTERKSRRTKSAVELRSTSDSSVRKQLTLAIVEGQTPTQISSAQWSSNGQQILLATNTGIQEVHAPEWKVQRVFSAGTGVSDAQFVSRAVQGGPQELDSGVLTFDGNTARLWNNESRKQIASFRGPFPIRDVALTSGDSPLAVSAGLTLRIFDGRVSEGQGGKPLFRIPEEQGVEVTCIAPDEQTSPRLAFADSSGVVRLGDWDQTTNTLMIRWSLKAVESPVAALRWTPKHDLLAVVSVLGEIVLVNTDGIATVRTRLPESPSCRVTSADIDSTGQFLALTGERVSTSESIGWILSDLMSQQGQQKTDPGAPVAERLANVVCQFSGHSAGGITAVHFVPSSPYLISGGHDGAIIIWNWQNPLPGSVPVAYEAYRFLSETQPAAHAAPVTSLDVSNTQLASAGEDGKVILWKLPESITAAR